MNSRILRVLYASFVLLSHLSKLFAVNMQVGNVSVRCIERERQSLLALKQGFVDHHGLLSSWGNGENQKECCTWKGVHCGNQKSRVVKLDLRGDLVHFYDDSSSINYLEGTISPSLVNLHHLNYLDLSSNNFSNLTEFPKVVTSLTHLKYLNLSHMNMGGKIPFELGDLFRLKYLDLGHNRFGGEIPTQLGNLSRLVYLDLGNNLHLLHQMFLRSNLEWMSHLTSLNSLSLDGADLGSAKNWIKLVSNLSLLQELHCSSCNLTNTEFLSSTFNNINSSSLAIVDLSYNNLTSLVFPWLLSYRDSLNYLDLSWSSLRSNLEWMSHLTSLNSLSLDGADLGSAKNWIKLISNLSLLQELHCSSCNITNTEFLSSTFNNINSSSLAIVDLSYNKLTSLVFPWLSSYRDILNSLRLNDNQLSGPIPEAFGNFTSLQELHLDNNQLEGGIPKLLLDTCSLRVLDISANNLSGRLEEFVSTSNRCASKSLQKLYLSHNRITGSVPDLSQFSSLQILILDSNQLNGTLSDRIGQLSNLASLSLSDNSLQGEISEAHFSRLSKLKNLDLSFNALVFNVSSDWIPPFQLYYVTLASCKLGPTFPMWLQTQKEYTELDISSAKIFNTIPNWFWKPSLNLLTLNLSYNQIRGKIPNLPLESFIDFAQVDLSWNMFEGSIPSFLSKTSELYISNNKFSKAHSLLCANTTKELRHLDLSNNQFIEKLPECWTSFKSLKFLDLRKNQFFGHIPSSMGALTYIQALHLGKNNLTGTLPQSISNCTQLTFFEAESNNLFGPIPTYIGETWQNLEVLSLRSNNFNGSLPLKICHLAQLQILDLSLNNISGSIPKCFNNLSAMMKQVHLNTATSFLNPMGAVYKTSHFLLLLPSLSLLGKVMFNDLTIVDSLLLMWKGKESEYRKTLRFVKCIDLSSNRLVGEIPKEIMNLTGLISLNFSRNMLSGEISEAIGQLGSLDVLDLSRNHLSGKIPSQLSQLGLLGVLNLSYNNLSGEIPTSPPKLQSFDAFSYVGNSELCGTPLSKCPEKKTGEHDAREKDDDEGDFMQGFYISMAIGFVVGFWGVCCSLFFKKSWGYAYFRFLSDMYDKLYVLVAINMAKLQMRIRASA